MDFLRQTLIEIKNIFRSKFLFILGILVLAMSIVMPVIAALSNNPANASNFMSTSSSISYDMAYYNEQEEPITVDGVTITSDNPFYWNIRQYEEESEYVDVNNFDNPETYDIMTEMGEMEREYYIRFAKVITSYEDYRFELAWYGSEALYDIYLYEHNDVDPDVLKEALDWRRGYDNSTFETKYINITEEQRQTGIEEAQAYLDRVYQVVENSDFAAYIALSIEQQQGYIEDNEEEIAANEDTISDYESEKAKAEQKYNDMLSQNADESLLKEQTGKIESTQKQIDSLQEQIDNLYTYIETINDITIPALEYRLANNIVPGDGSWQDSALSSRVNSESQLGYQKIVSEEEFNEGGYKQEYGTYAKYKAAMEKRIEEYQKDILIAQNSLDTGKPDMKFVPDGARSQTVNFLYYSVFVALLGVVMGGWQIASEFQMGTIRLLIIRPKTRTKILMSKFTAALAVCLGIYIVGALVNMIMNGMLFGFSDFGFPNYTASGAVGFLAYFLPKFLACAITVIFGFCLAFMLSTLVKNIAVSIAVPIVCFIGCFIGIGLVGYNRSIFDWLAYTPVPYVQVSSFFTENSVVNRMIEEGAPISLGYGLGMLTGISVICTAVSVWVFKKKDITH